MSTSLPPSLQKLIDEMPRNYEYRGRIIICGRRLTEKCDNPGDKKRVYRYWLTRTGQVVTTTFYPKPGRVGVLTGICGAWGDEPQILGRAPGEKSQKFKIWRGVRTGFGAREDEEEFVIKGLDEPEWVAHVRGGGNYYDWVGTPGKTKRKLPFDEFDEYNDQPVENEEPDIAPTTRAQAIRKALEAPRQNELRDDDISPSDDEEPLWLSSKRRALEASRELDNSSFQNAPDNSKRGSPLLKTQDRQSNGRFARNIEGPIEIRSQTSTGTNNDQVAIGNAAAGCATDLGSVSVCFRVARDSGISDRIRPWTVCDTLENLFNQAVAARLLESSGQSAVLDITIFAGAQEKVTVRVVRGDEEDFNVLRDKLVNACKAFGAPKVKLQVRKV